MLRGPDGEKAPAGEVGGSIGGRQPAPGVVEEELEIRSAAAQLGSKGGKARAAKLSNEQRKAIARKAAEKRWKKNVDTAQQ